MSKRLWIENHPIEAKNFIQRYDSNQDSKVSVEEINSQEFYDNVSN